MNIRLPEHNSSRLIFVPSNITGNNPDFKLYIEDTTTDSNCSCSGDSEYPSNWLLGKLNNYCWYLEDCGIYDSNHYHTANIYYYDNSNVKQNYITVTRSMEYGEESDRLYCEHSGSLKVLLYDYSEQNVSCNFYIKYERNLPAAKEALGNLTDTTTGETIYNCVAFYKYNNENQLIMTEAIQLSFALEVVNEEDNTPMTGINYCSIEPTRATCDTTKLALTAKLNENTLTDIRVGLIGTNSLGEKNPSYHYYGKFMPVDYYENNYQPIDPSYFIVQAPKNGWIALRIGIGSGTLLYNNRYKDGIVCGFIRQVGAGLTGYFGNWKSSSATYQYDIELNRNTEPCMIMIPKLYWNYSQIIWKNSSGSSVSYSGLPQEELYNELDGMFYRIFILPPSSPIQKITLHYSKI